MEEKEIKNIEVGNFIFLHTTYQTGIAGAVLGKGEYIDGEGHTQRYLRMRISENNYMDVYESQIDKILMYCPKEDFEKYWTEFEEKYNVKCLDDEGNLRSIPAIINEIFAIGVWDKLNDEEKETFVKNLNVDCKTDLDLMNALNVSSKRNNELHEKVCELTDKRIETLQKAIDFEKQYDDMIAVIPEQYKWAFDFLYRWFGIEKFLKEI